MSYPLDPLLFVRNLRESQAQTQLRLAEARLIEAKQDTFQKQSELAEYQSWHAKEVDTRYAKIMGSVLETRELENFNAGLAYLDNEELLKNQSFEDAKKAELKQSEAVQFAQAKLRQASQNTQKIAMHKEIWQAEFNLEKEKAEEAELEEFVVLSDHGAEQSF